MMVREECWSQWNDQLTVCKKNGIVIEFNARLFL